MAKRLITVRNVGLYIRMALDRVNNFSARYPWVTSFVSSGCCSQPAGDRDTDGALIKKGGRKW